ncbi:MAG: hypothetical protein GXO88_14000 [Chlorobi bacterium]|nr:hypothetical protein [Chlorobiota bacterium]
MNIDKTVEKDSLAKANFGLSPEDQYKTTLTYDMTLSEVSKANSISLNYLKMKLNIPQNLKHDYKLGEINKNFHFTLEDIDKFISLYHNEKTAREKTTMPINNLNQNQNHEK